MAGQNPLPLIQLACNQLDISVCQLTPDFPVFPDCEGCPASPVTCHQMQYMVRLAAPGNITTSNAFELEYAELEMTTPLVYSNISPSGMTRFNEAATGAGCPNSPVDFDGDQKALIKYLDVGGSSGKPPITFTRTQAGATFYAHLYTVVVDIYPGDQVSLGCTYFRYAANSDNACYYPSQENPPVPTFITEQPYTLALDADQKLRFNFGNPIFQPANNPTAAVVGVNLKSFYNVPLSVPYLDFSFTLQSTEDMPPPTFLNATGYEIIVSPSTGEHKNYVVKVRSTSPINFFAMQDKALFQVRLERPNPQNLTSSASLDFSSGRFEGFLLPSNSFCKTMVEGASPATVEFQGDGPCGNPDFALNVTGTQSVGGDCAGLQVDVSLSGIPALSYIKELRFVLEFEFTNGAAIDEANIQNTLPCNTDNNSICEGIVGDGNCYKVNNSRFTYCYMALAGTDGVQHTNGNLHIPILAPSGCIKSVKVREAVLHVNYHTRCVPKVTRTGFDLICSRQISGKVKYGASDDCYVEGTEIHIAEVNLECPPNTTLTADAPYAYCVCDEGEFSIRPEKTDNPVTGVTAYDLVLISKHILGIELFDGPYKMIAADANNSGSITTFDIVELRKLTLGIYTELPKLPSWRFLPKDWEIPNPTNPFFFGIPDPDNVVINATIDANGIQYHYDQAYILPPPGVSYTVTRTPSSASFRAIKVGDVNCSTAPTLCDDCGTYAPRPHASSSPFRVEVPGRAAKAGEVLLLPVVASSSEALVAYQAGLRFDPERYEFLSVAAGEADGLSPDCFNLLEAEQGKLRVLWLSPDQESELVQPGQTLFCVALRARTEIPEGEMPLRTDERFFESYGISDQNVQLPFEIALRRGVMQRSQGGQADGSIALSCAPNPTSGAVTLSIEAKEFGPVRAFVFGPYGERLYYRELDASAGLTTLALPEVAAWPPGIYTFLVQAGKEKATLRFVKE